MTLSENINLIKLFCLLWIFFLNVSLLVFFFLFVFSHSFFPFSNTSGTLRPLKNICKSRLTSYLFMLLLSHILFFAGSSKLPAGAKVIFKTHFLWKIWKNILRILKVLRIYLSYTSETISSFHSVKCCGLLAIIFHFPSNLNLYFLQKLIRSEFSVEFILMKTFYKERKKTCLVLSFHSSFSESTR